MEEKNRVGGEIRINLEERNCSTTGSPGSVINCTYKIGVTSVIVNEISIIEFIEILL